MIDHRKTIQLRNAAKPARSDNKRRLVEIEERLHRLHTQMEIWELEEDRERLIQAQVEATCNLEGK